MKQRDPSGAAGAAPAACSSCTRQASSRHAALAAAAEVERARAELVVEETVGRYHIWLLSSWPQRRPAA